MISTLESEVFIQGMGVPLTYEQRRGLTLLSGGRITRRVERGVAIEEDGQLVDVHTTLFYVPDGVVSHSEIRPAQILPTQ